MKQRDIKETMEQIHIPEEMQERIITNVWERMVHGSHGTVDCGERNCKAECSATKKHGMGSQEAGRYRAGGQRTGKKEAGNWKKTAATAAVLALAVVILSVPVQAVVTSLTRARMEDIPEKEVQGIAESVQGQKEEADSFSRELTDRENERMRELWQAYEEGTFPERTIPLMEHAEEAMEGELCYVWENSFFYLPERELTDEELLEIIDFNCTRNYALSQTQAAQESRREYEEERERMREQILAAGGISEEEAVKIAEARMKETLGELAEEVQVHVAFLDISDADYEHKGDMAYMMIFSTLKNGAIYTCTVDSMDGSVLEEGE